MGFRKHNPRPTSPPTKPNKGKEEILLLIPNAIVHLAGDPNASAVEVGRGYLTVCRITEDSVALATVIKVGEDLRWPLTKDEPVAKLDRTHYLFSIPDKDGSFLNYGVSFAGEDGCLASFDRFLMENACFSAFPSAESSSYAKAKNCETYWKDYAPKIEDYNGALAKAIAQGTGEIVKGIFKLSDAYSTQGEKAIRNDRKDESGIAQWRACCIRIPNCARGSVSSCKIFLCCRPWGNPTGFFGCNFQSFRCNRSSREESSCHHLRRRRRGGVQKIRRKSRGSSG
ncbi:hypothetical protein HPP92_022970 [Vanilla planifolia]|uniref:Uncharacterized protein n=1 Tax=Vanilla planifolia TaxID=51239 RepID=A0A835PRW5_VANPL|nr:hypothetical protein HPP92_022970 [Vanilla planifolia]